MSGVLPSVDSGGSCIYPVNRSWTTDTFISQSYAGTEQRAKRRSSLAGFTLQYNNISLSDKQALDAFVTAQKGAFDSTWSFNLQSALPVNGSFAFGLNGWRSIPYAQWFQPYAASSGGFNNGPAAVLQTSPTFLPAGSPSLCSLVSTPIPYKYGYTYLCTVDFYLGGHGPFTNLSLSADVLIQLLNASGTVIGNVGGPTTATALGQWTQIQFPFASLDQAVTSFQILPQASIYANASMTLTASQCAVLVSGVNVFDQSGGGPFTNCAFDQDEITWTQNQQYPDRWSGSIKFRQTAVGGIPYGYVNQGVFPQVRQGVVTGYPYTPSYRFSTDRNDLPSGPRIAYAWYGSGIPRFPNRALRGWGLSFNNASDDELYAMEHHFITCGGKYLGFSFTDPDTGVSYGNVRYDMDSFDVTHKQVNCSDFKVSLAEYWT